MRHRQEPAQVTRRTPCKKRLHRSNSGSRLRWDLGRAPVKASVRSLSNNCKTKRQEFVSHCHKRNLSYSFVDQWFMHGFDTRCMTFGYLMWDAIKTKELLVATFLQRTFASLELASTPVQNMAPGSPEPKFTGVADPNPEKEVKDTKDLRDAEKGMDVPAEEQSIPPTIMLVVMLSMYQGYASMVGPLQAAYKHELGLKHGTSAAHVFTQAAVGVHYGKLIARLGHGIVFACLSPRTRVLIAMIFMFAGVLIPPLFVFTLKWHWVYSVFVSYMMSGVGLGTFAPTFLSVITPLGKATKSWAIVGCPAGFAIINILGLGLTSFEVPVVYIYWYIVACLPVGFYVFLKYAPHDKAELRTANLGASLQQGRSWMPKMVPFYLAQFFSHFAMQNWPAIFYMFHPPKVPLFNPHSDQHLVDWALFFAVTYIFTFLGDSISRRIAIYLKTPSLKRRLLFLSGAMTMTVTGLYLESLAIAIIIPLAIFLIFWGNGTIYGLTVNHVDSHVPSEHNLAAYSSWSFIGDLGSILGGILVDSTHDLFCRGHEGPFECWVRLSPYDLDGSVGYEQMPMRRLPTLVDGTWSTG